MNNKQMVKPLLILSLLISSSSIWATDYFVSPSGSNANSGTSSSKAFKTIAYACDQVPAGAHTIHLAAGTYVETQTAFLKTGVTLEGSGTVGPQATIVTNASGFGPVNSPCDFEYENYLLAVSDKDNFAIRDIAFKSRSDLQLDGAINVKYSGNFTIENVDVSSFRWAGIYLRECSNFEVKNSAFTNANTERHCNTWSGNLRTRYIENAQIHHNTFKSDISSGYGYKASGHENVRFHHNTIESNGEFAFESAHEHEYALEIDSNVMNRCISIPKPDGGANPANRGYTYAIDIHHNRLSDSYTVEGPRNYLIIRDNFINITKTGGRVYSHHGGTNTAWIKIYNNVVLNLDRSFAWANSGTALNLKIYNNTIYCADAGSRTGAVLDFPSSNSITISGWEFKNNVVIAPESKPRSLYWNNTNATNVSFAKNLTININSTPSGTITGVAPGFKLSGTQPFPYYAPASATSAVVNNGVDVGLPYVGTNPDIGAYEFNPYASAPSALSPLADAFVRGGSSSNTNYGGEDVLIVKESGDSNNDRKSFLKFDVSDLGGGIENAVLKLYVAAIGGESVTNRQIVLRKVSNDSWQEGGITWSNQPATGDVIATKTITGADVGSTISWDVTNYLLNESGGDGMMSVALVQPSGVEGVVSFSSKEGMSSPELQLTYSTLSSLPLADAYVRGGNNAGENFGNTSQLYVKESSDISYDRISYVKFNVNATAGEIGQATLKLYVQSIGGENVTNRPINFLKVANDSWSETGVNWSNKPALGALLATKTITASSVGQVITVDVTNYVKAEANGDGVVTIGISQPSNESALVVFSSKEGAVPPALDISTMSTSDYIVRARMISGSSDQLQLRVDDVTIHTWTINSGSFANYFFTGPSGNNVKLYFRDAGTDLEVDNLTINSTTYQAENQSVNTAVWQNGSCGGSSSQLMHCEGHIDFGDVSGARNTGIPEDSELTENGLFKVYPIPSSGPIFIDLIEESEIEASVFTTSGKLVYQEKQTGDFELNLQPGLYIMLMKGENLDRSVKLIVN